MKSDDDTFVVVPNLVHVLLGGTVPAYNATNGRYDQLDGLALDSANRLEITENLLIGRQFSRAIPISDSNNKWFAPHYLYAGKFYPDYLAGAGYLMSIDVAAKLYDAALLTPLFYLEDVYLTGRECDEYFISI